MTIPTDIADRLRLRIEWSRRGNSEAYLMRLALEEIERLRSGQSAEAELRAAVDAAVNAQRDAEIERDTLRDRIAELEPRIEKAKAAWKKVKAERDELERRLIAADPRRQTDVDSVSV